MTPSRLGFVEHEAIGKLCLRAPRIGAALWRETLVDAAVFREWMTSIGQRAAPVRIAHLFCEMFYRYRAIGSENGNTVPFPITQGEIGDALGLSIVHVNRSIQALRRQKLIKLTNGILQVLNWAGLQEAGDFEPAYLHLAPAKQIA